MPKKIQKIALDRHISGHTLPRIQDADWAELEVKARVSFNKKSRVRMQEIVNRYVEQILLHKDGRRRLKLLGDKNTDNKKLIELQKATQKFLKKWNVARQDETIKLLLNDFDAELTVKSKGSRQFLKTIDDFEANFFIFRLYLKKLDQNPVQVKNKHSKSTAKKSAANPIEYLIQRLAHEVTKAGGKASKTKPADTKNFRLPAFHQFIAHLLNLLPEEFQYHWNSSAAMATFVQRALKK